MSTKLQKSFDLIYDCEKKPLDYPGGLVTPNTIYGLDLTKYNYLKVYVKSTNLNNADNGTFDIHLKFGGMYSEDGYPYRGSFICIDGDYYRESEIGAEQMALYFIQGEVSEDKKAFGINYIQGYLSLYDGKRYVTTDYMKVVRIEGRY